MVSKDTRISHTDGIPASEDNQRNPIPSGNVGVRIMVRVRSSLVLQLTKTFCQIRAKFNSRLDKSVLWNTVLEYEVVGSSEVAVQDHKQHRLKPYQIDRSRTDQCRLSRVVQEKVLSIVERRHLSKSTSNTTHVSACHCVKTVEEDLLNFATALVENLEQTFLGVRQNWENRMNVDVVAAPYQFLKTK